MPKATIFAIAAICGLIAFTISIFVQSPGSPRRSAETPMVGGRGFFMANNDWPSDLQGMEARVLDDPSNPEAWSRLAPLRQAAGDEPGARAAWQEVISQAESQAGGPGEQRLLFIIAWAHYKLGNSEQASLFASKAEQIYTSPSRPARWDSSPVVYHRIGWLRTIMGDAAGAQNAWRQAVRLLEAVPTNQLGSAQAYDLACNLALIGRKQPALDMLDRARTMGYNDAGQVAIDDDLASLRDDPAFARIIRRMRNPRIIHEGG